MRLHGEWERVRQCRNTGAWMRCRRRVAGLIVLGLLAGCAAGGPSFVDRKVEEAEIDFERRQERLLDAVLERPARVERLRRERERHKRQGDLESWEAIRVRQELFLERRAKRRLGDQEQFMRMIDRLREQEEARDFERSERWVQFLEGDRQAPQGQGTPPVSAQAPR